jgi:HPt (histidine-containing phosphotransfer) domain-containing protein
MGKTVGLLALLVAIVASGAIWMTSFKHSVQPVVAKPDPAFCAHVSDLKTTLTSIRNGAGGSSVAGQLGAEQQELASDATRLATTSRSVDAATAASLATQVEQLRETVVFHDGATARSLVSALSQPLGSVRGC